MEKKQFKAESKRLLDLMINSIYTNKEIFLRELVSNASDAIDKLAYLALTDQSIDMNRSDFKIELIADEEAKTLTIRDNGIGMSRQEMEENLGTIAHSGSLSFKNEMEKNEDIDIIGQFGVGFYSAFMVADSIRVISKKFGSEEAFCWESAGADGYTITPCEAENVGTQVILALKEEEYLQESRLRTLIRKYSDYIRYPILIGEEKLNSMLPIWNKRKQDVAQEEYESFYKEKYFDFEKPLSVLHFGVEGAVTYKALLYIPAKAPYDFYTKDYKAGLQLYSSGVLIMENCEELLPEHFRFVRGVIDTQDVSLNISREMLQQTRELKAIANNVEKKIKAELARLLENDRETYDKFYAAFGRQLKFGLVSDFGAHKELLQDLVQFRSDKEDKLVTLKEYCEAMPVSQKHIYFASGENAARLAQTQMLRGRGFDVLLMTEQVDEFIPQAIGDYAEHEFRNILTDELDLATDEEKKAAEEKSQEFKNCLDFIKETLGEKVAEVNISNDLGDYPISMVPQGGMSFEMEKYFRSMDPDSAFTVGKVLQLNPDHAAILALNAAVSEAPEKARKYAQLLYCQGLLTAGLPLEDPMEYTKLVCDLMI